MQANKDETAVCNETPGHITKGEGQQQASGYGVELVQEYVQNIARLAFGYAHASFNKAVRQFSQGIAQAKQGSIKVTGILVKP